MKAINKCLKLLTASSLCIAVTTPIIALSSCSEDLQIKSIFIKPQRQTVEPGKYVQMLLYCEPRKAKKPAVK
ncbi:MAG: hypothetical protein MJ200_04130 [Mycoplasmoidaceae bacterium]|nr:hypothetical protein [Mycoplasmoidaceae bacterium]